jgi:glutamine---fructose-6-phosphate transaminase (isomerizing)
MCGIFGILQGEHPSLRPDEMKRVANSLFLLSESRGKEASGIAAISHKKIQIYKHPIPASALIRRPRYQNLFSDDLLGLIGHSRLVTNGHQGDNANNQPVISGDSLAIHNGIIVNDLQLAKKFSTIELHHQVDTEVLVAFVDLCCKQGFTLPQAVSKAFSLIEGSASTAILFRHSHELILATNTGSLQVAVLPSSRLIVFASEKYIVQKTLQQHNISPASYSMISISAGQAMMINMKSLHTSSFTLRAKKDHHKTIQTRQPIFTIEDVSSQESLKGPVTFMKPVLNSIATLRRHVPPVAAINALRRCKKCILPETMPYISFDESGVCSYCLSHTAIKTKGVRALEAYVKPFRKKNGKPDCIVALSGGRDSSYGLHYVKTVLKMNPIAYTYDWGMITDIARRNQARLVGALGVDHVLVSANIKQKRQHIQQHIKAWLKKPDLGMVPLFMAGDKQAEYYVEELKRQTGIQLVIYCRGNELEDEKFKFTNVGITNGTPQGVLHNLSLAGKVRLATYYLKQYLANPSYINTSLFDTLFAYYSAYFMPHRTFLYLWHYIPWEEKTIISTLKHTYNWETAHDTISTWRIDDGTPSFYNYIYYTVQGFTEHDALRSNQIREGMITRKKALALTRQENKPRYASLKWYFDTVGLDGDRVLSVVDAMPKRYSLA